MEISNRTTIFLVSFHEWWSISCKFDRSVYLRKNLACRSLLKVGDNNTGCKKNLKTQATCLTLDYVDAFLQKLTVNSWHLLPRNFQLKIICQLCSIPMTSHNEHSVSGEEVYLDRGSLTWWLTNPSDELSNFGVQYLLKLKWLTNKLVFNNMIGVWRVWLLINTLQTPLFACDKHIRWWRKKRQSSS